MKILITARRLLRTATMAALPALLLVGPAHRAAATPPDVVTVTDTLLAVSDTHLFLLRSTGDNLGLHTAWRAETFLIALDPLTGEEEIWPVHAVTQTQEWLGEDERDKIVTATSRAEGAVDPFAIIAARNGIPVLGMAGEARERERQVFVFDGDLVDAPGAGRTFRMSLALALARAQTSLMAVAELVDDTVRMAPVSTRDLFREKRATAEHCSFTAFGWTMRFHGNTELFQPVRITCDDDEMMDRSSLIQLLPLEPGSDTE